MKKSIVPLLFLALSNPFSVSAAMQVLGTKANTAPGHLDADANFTKQNANNAELQATKADKDKVVRYWSDHADGTTLVAGTMVAYEGKIYHATQNFLKTAGATPDTFTAYFEVAGGTNDYNSLSNRPTLGTAAALNVGTSANNIPQIGPDGKIPSGVYNAGLSSQPTDTGQSLISSGASAYGWLSNVPLTTNPTGLLSTGGTLDLTGFQPLDPALTVAATLDGSGANKIVATDSSGYVGIVNIPSRPVVQADAPTAASAEGFYGSTTTGAFYYRAGGGIFNISTGTYTADPTLKTLTISPPTNGTIICSDAALSRAISCGSSGEVCSATAASGAVIAGITAQADSGYTFGAFTGDITGAAYNIGSVTLTVDKTGSATFTSTSEWTIEDSFATDTASAYTSIGGSTLSVTGGVAVIPSAYTKTAFTHSTNLGSSDMTVSAKVTRAVGASGSLYFRASATGGYLASINYGTTGDRLYLYSVSGTTFTQLTTIMLTNSIIWPAGVAHVMTASIQGSTITLKIDWNDDGLFDDAGGTYTVSDSTITTGTLAGFGAIRNGGSTSIDDFKANAL